MHYTIYEPLVLRATKFLPSLKGVRWDNEDLFLPEQKIIFKREKLNFTIIKETKDNDTSKYEMFQRLNTGSTHLSAQEIRNCLLIMISKPFYELINDLSKDTNFKESFLFTETQYEERYDLELVVRYFLYTDFSDEFIDKIDKSRNIDTFITEQLEIYVQTREAIFENNKEKFHRIFSLLNNLLNENAFKKCQDNKFKGPSLLASFESIIPGLFIEIDYWESHHTDLIEKIKQIYNRNEFITATRRGTRALDRVSQLIKFSRMWFSHEN